MPRASSSAVRSIPDTIPPENRTLGWAVLAWTADYLLQPDGPNAGQPWKYTPEQTRVVLRWYQIDDKGRWANRRGVLRRMKGWGKEPFLASLAAVELCGPCRFGGWDANGQPVAIEHPAPWIQVAAVNLDQTHNTMRLFPGMFSKAAIEEYRIDPGKQVIYARGCGQIEAVTSSPRALEGGRGTLVIANETQHWVQNNEGLAMAEVIRRNLAKSRDGAARVMEITNAHLPGEGSAAEQTYEAWRQAGGKLAGVYYDSVEAPPIKDLEDTEAVRKGLLAARGDSTWLDVDRLLEEIADPTTPEWLSRRFYLNQVVQVGSERWIQPEKWDACAEQREIAAGTSVVLGFDDSFNGDATALVVVAPGEVPYLDVVRVWERSTTDPPDWTVPIEDVEDEIRACCERWRVLEVAADPYRWQRSLEILAKERIPVVEYPQRPARMIPATQKFTDAVLNGTMRHSGNADLGRHVANAVLKVTSQGSQLTKDHKMSPRRIDLAVASVMAFDRASHAEARTAHVFLPSDLSDDEPAPESDVLGFRAISPDEYTVRRCRVCSVVIGTASETTENTCPDH